MLFPIGVVADVVMRSVVKHSTSGARVQLEGEKEAVAPEGRPEAEKFTRKTASDAAEDKAVNPRSTEPPTVTLALPILEREKSTNGACTVSKKAIVFVTPPPAPVTVMLELPRGVVPRVVTVIVVPQVGVQLGALKEAVAPDGKPETEKDTGCGDPLW